MPAEAAARFSAAATGAGPMRRPLLIHRNGERSSVGRAASQVSTISLSCGCSGCSGRCGVPRGTRSQNDEPIWTNRVDRQVQELTHAKTGASDEFDGETIERILDGTCGHEQPRCGGVVDETWHSTIEDGRVGVGHQPGGGSVG